MTVDGECSQLRPGVCGGCIGACSIAVRVLRRLLCPCQQLLQPLAVLRLPMLWSSNEFQHWGAEVRVATQIGRAMLVARPKHACLSSEHHKSRCCQRVQQP